MLIVCHGGILVLLSLLWCPLTRVAGSPAVTLADTTTTPFPTRQGGHTHAD